MGFKYTKLVWASSQQKSSHKLTMLALAEITNEQTGCCMPSHETLAIMVGVTSRQIRKILDDLSAAGEIEIATGRGRNHTNQYNILLVNRNSTTYLPDADNRNCSSYIEPKIGTVARENRNCSSYEPTTTTLSNDSVAMQPPQPLAVQFQKMIEELKTTKNRAAKLVEVYTLLYGKETAPAFGYMLKIANQIGGAGYMATRLWELSARPPNGDVLAYLLAEHKSKIARVNAAQRNGTGGNADPAIWHKLQDQDVPDYMREPPNDN